MLSLALCGNILRPPVKAASWLMQQLIEITKNKVCLLLAKFLGYFTSMFSFTFIIINILVKDNF